MLLPLLSLLVPDTFFASPAFNPFDIDFDTTFDILDDTPPHQCKIGMVLNIVLCY